MELQPDHPTKVEPVLEGQIPAPRERSSSDSPKSSLESKIHSSDHSAYMSPRLKSILLWEKPVVSAAHLATALTMVLLCRWVSLLNLVCGLFVIGISASFAYVNGMLLLGRVTNKPATSRPLGKYYQRSAEFVHVEADALHRRVGFVTDGLNVVITELAKVVLIEDNKRSLKFMGIFYAIWTLRTWFSTTTLLSAVLISLFTFPRLYIDNQTLIDSHVAKTSDLVQEQVGKGRQKAQEHLSSVYTKAEQFAQSKGLMKKAQKAE
ncbi:Reticulon-4 [Lobosporangium transversale]|uniref:Reticulon-like protein n=1 Tax=Lobosporangium transversale TaxID=64571 RepID=A0A1Y2H2I9_9FUNG|nr:Reticulon-domain-containing protein [Lobosporangium transversale]KAF9918706.1 Reticulon-4 [Lobosporangium transversale]ORZ28755.1 Reticulon-domain-containing protein [Lobosporangium transversale]|eukprot:XP_021886428.1 Reticulon-domain-containing protein [Lobosporangium transversale]